MYHQYAFRYKHSVHSLNYALIDGDILLNYFEYVNNELIVLIESIFDIYICSNKMLLLKFIHSAAAPLSHHC